MDLRTLQGELSKWTSKNQVKTKKNTSSGKANKPNKSNEKLSPKDIEELMGIRKPIYKRSKGGAIKQK